MIHSITVEPLTKTLRQMACLDRDPAHLAIVERTNGNLVKVCATTGDYATAYPTARGYARMYGATVLTASSYAPTVVGADIAEMIAARPDCRPAARADAPANRCDFIGCGSDAMPGSDDCLEHQHAVAAEHRRGTQSTVVCACGETFGPIGEPNDRRRENHADVLALHAKHAANA